MIILNEQQEAVVQAAVNWYHNSSEQTFQYDGFGGTGKSVVLFEIVRRLGLSTSEIAPCAYTGSAALVMRRKGLLTARTIHSLLYEAIEVPIKDRFGKPVLDPYFNVPKVRIQFIPKELYGVKLILIDEASMVPMEIRKEIDRRGIKVIACGDTHQLPPVASEPGYLIGQEKVYHLTQIVRQAEGSPIIYLSMRAYEDKPIHKGCYGNVIVIDPDELTDAMLLYSDIVLCGTNRTRDGLNARIRELRFPSYVNNDLPLRGESIICRKNNWTIATDSGINLANGLVGRVVSELTPEKISIDGYTFDMDFLPYMSQVPFKDLTCSATYFKANYERRLELKDLPFVKGEKFEFAYAITTHLSQGSQYTNGIYIEERLRGNMNNRLNYTGITRFTNNLIFVKCRKRYW